MVAMFGWIMPAPFAMPVIVTVSPPISTRRDTAFGTVSVVMIARAAGSQLSSLRAAHTRRQAGGDAIDRQWLHDDAGGKRQHLLGCDAEQPRRLGAGALRIGQYRAHRSRRWHCRC